MACPVVLAVLPSLVGASVGEWVGDEKRWLCVLPGPPVPSGLVIQNLRRVEAVAVVGAVGGAMRSVKLLLGGGGVGRDARRELVAAGRVGRAFDGRWCVHSGGVMQSDPGRGDDLAGVGAVGPIGDARGASTCP